jgi:hypothetical protein
MSETAYCECGCGQPTTFDPSRWRQNRFVHGHNARKSLKGRGQVRGAMDLRAKAIKAVREAMDRERIMDPNAERDGFSADGAARVIGAYEDVMRGA